MYDTLVVNDYAVGFAFEDAIFEVHAQKFNIIIHVPALNVLILLIIK